MASLGHDESIYIKDIKLPWIFLGAPLNFNGAPRNMHGNLDKYAYIHCTAHTTAKMLGQHKAIIWTNAGNSNSNLGNKLKWKLNRNPFIFVQENALEYAVWKMAAILSPPQCVKNRSKSFLIYKYTSTVAKFHVMCEGMPSRMTWNFVTVGAKL